MGVLDIIFIIPIVWLAYKGFSKGLIIELATLAALVLGIYASLPLLGGAIGAFLDLVERLAKIIAGSPTRDRYPPSTIENQLEMW